MKEFVKKKFPRAIGLANRIYNFLYHLKFYNKSREDVFSSIYVKNHWSDSESVSGPGSSLVRTTSIREKLPKLISKYNIHSILDIPCGDFNWMKEIDMANLRYVGMDIVREIVNKNERAHSTLSRNFEFGDITSTELPKSDLIFCRDCLVHLSYEDIYRAVQNMKRSGAIYLLTTTFTSHLNHNIITGDWRPINLNLKPFNWPPALELIGENETGEYIDKSMALWRVGDLK